MTRKHAHDGPSVLMEDPHVQAVAQRTGHVWDCRFATAIASDGEHVEVLAIIDVQTGECLAILAEHHIGSQEVTDHLFDLFVLKGPPECIRPGNAPLPMAEALRDWLKKTGAKTRFVKREKSRPSERAESFGRRLQHEIIDRGTFADLAEAKTTIEGWRNLYNQTPLTEPAGNEATIVRVPSRQSSRDSAPELPRVFRRHKSLEGGSSQAARSHDPPRNEVEGSLSVQSDGSLDHIETGQSVQCQESLGAIGSRQSAERQGPLDHIDAGQSVQHQQSIGAIETGQSVERHHSLDQSGTGQSEQCQGHLGVIETGQADECQGSLLAIGAGQSVEHHGTDDDVETDLTAYPDGQSVQRHDEIEISPCIRHQGPDNDIPTSQSIVRLGHLDNHQAGQVVERHSPASEIGARQATQHHGPLDEIPTGQSVQQRVYVHDEAEARGQGRSRRAVAAVIGLVAPSLRPAPSPRHGRPTIREMKRTVVRATEWAGIVVVILLVAVVAVTLTAPYFGWRVDTVRSGSMEPELKVGSIVVTRPVDSDEIGVGDVITFRSLTSGEIVSRRVSAIEEGPSFRTEGIADGEADPFVTPAQGVVGRVCFHLPVAGYVVQRLVTPVGMLLLFAFGFAIVVSEIISMFQLRWRQPA